MSHKVWSGEADEDGDEAEYVPRHGENDSIVDNGGHDADETQDGREGEVAQEAAQELDDYFGPFETGTRSTNGLDQADSTPTTPLRTAGWTEEPGPSRPLAQRDVSSNDTLSIPDDTPSVRDSRLSSPGLAASPLSRKHVLRTASGALQPFERRFESRLSSSPLSSPRVASPGFLSPASRQISLSSQFSPASSQAGADSDEPAQAPWEVVRWTRLRKLTSQLFTETGRRNFGRPTCLAVSALIAVGTTKGFVLGFDYHQTLKIIMGPGTRAAECGSVTALAISADYSTICSGHSNGFIFTWEVNRPARPFIQIPPLDRNALSQPQHPDGHVAGSTILHIGFLGMRHTAIVSADSSGMAFSHLASRGLGPVTRTMSTTRLLGRYPQLNARVEQARKPSSVLAFSPLPLGNVEQSTDQLGLTALLTPYLLVIVSTTPSAQTQHKASRPKEVSPHSTLSGCLAWFPSVKLKSSARASARDTSNAKLVYCWSNILSILDVHILPSDPKDAQRPPSLEFVTRSRWRAEEAIVAVQWLGRSVLAALTISQRLLIIEDGNVQVTDSLDLLPRHIYHQDLFSKQLKPVVEQLDVEDPSMHGVVADAFYMSFRAYKSRLFLLSFNDVAVGTLSNWADRLIALMEAGDHIAAIRLATDYYTGSANNVTIGLPDDSATRHEMVKERLLAMMTASLRYSIAQVDQAHDERLTELAEVCFQACVTIDEREYLCSTVFEAYEDADAESIFVRNLEQYVLEGDIVRVPADVVKSTVSHFISENKASDLEELLCRLDPHSFDLDEMTIICKQHNLYDALIFIWTQAIKDFVTPLIDLLQLVKLVATEPDTDRLSDNPFYQPAIKIFPYLAFSLTGRVYPKGEIMTDEDAAHARAELYGFLFSGRAIPWPPGSNNVFHIVDQVTEEPAFPYLTILLQFDAASFLSMLNEAFEDPSLNEADGSLEVDVKQASRRSGFKITRQHIISIMLDVMRQGNFDADDIIFLDIFIARNLAKYSNQLVLSGTLLDGVLQRLCQPPSPLLREDCQLSVEYLLSVYQPADLAALIERLKESRFHKVLKTIYRRQKLFLELVEEHFLDPDDQGAIFDQISQTLSADSLTPKQVFAIKESIVQHANQLTEIDTPRTARLIATVDLSLLEALLEAIADSNRQFILLRSLLEPGMLRQDFAAVSLHGMEHAERSIFEERYVQLMCRHEPGHVADYVSLLESGDLRLSEVLPAMEDSGVVDAEVMLLTKDGAFVDAMSRLVRHLQSLQKTLLSLLEAIHESPDAMTAIESAEGLLEEVSKYTKVGIWLCQSSSKAVDRKTRRPPLDDFVDEATLDLDEHLWLDLLDALVQLTQKVSLSLRLLDEHPLADITAPIDVANFQELLRPDVQQAFTALLVATSAAAMAQDTATEKNRSKRPQSQLSFLRVLRAFLQRAAAFAPSLSDLREVLSDIFTAYAFEQDVLTMANDLLGADVFVDIQKAHAMRQQGWRPKTQVCESCKRRAWGPATGEIVWDEYVSAELDKTAKKTRKAMRRGGTEEAKRLERGKGRMSALFVQGLPSPAVAPDPESRKLTLVIFASSSRSSIMQSRPPILQAESSGEMPLSFWHVAAALGASGVMLGAFGAHGLKGRISDPARLANWGTAAHYQLLHSVALLTAEAAAPKNIWAKSLFTAGIVMFSGSIYALVFDPQRFKFLGPVTPIGGLCLIGGWAALAFGSRGRIVLE